MTISDLKKIKAQHDTPIIGSAGQLEKLLLERKAAAHQVLNAICDNVEPELEKLEKVNQKIRELCRI